MVIKGTPDAIATQNHSTSHATRANHAATPHSPSHSSISDGAMTKPFSATSGEIRDPFVSDSPVETGIVGIDAGVDRQESAAFSHCLTTVPKDVPVTSVSGATTSLITSGFTVLPTSSPCLANAGIPLGAAPDFVARARSSSNQYPSDEDTTVQPASV